MTSRWSIPAPSLIRRRYQTTSAKWSVQIMVRMNSTHDLRRAPSRAGMPGMRNGTSLLIMKKAFSS